MFEFPVQLSEKDSIATIDLNRPDDGNKLTRDMMRQLTAKLRDLSRIDQLQAIVIGSRGPAFCRGRDGSGENTASLSAYETREQSMSAVLGVYAAIRESPVPVIAKVHGDALGFGAALAGSCDITLAVSSANFAFGEMLNGIPPTMAMTPVMRNLSPKALSWLIYSGESVDAARAADIGLVSKVWRQEEFESSASAFVSQIATRSRRNLETVKKFQTLAANMTPEAASDYAGALLALVRAS